MSPNTGIATMGNAVSRQEFGGSEVQSRAELAVAAVAARERAECEAAYVMAERHQRNWNTVRVRLLEHCRRPGFAAIARYSKPTGKKKVNGQWTETFAEGLSVRFAEIARQEMANVKSVSAAIYEDDMIRIVRTSVIDLERNTHDSRDTVIAKAQEKRGKKNSKGEWEPPEGREIISQRINSYGEPVFLCKATDDEIRQKQNAEVSRTQRDESLRLIPKDIRDDCEAQVIATQNDPKATDPAMARKRVFDAFATLSITPDDLQTYLNCAIDKMSPAQRQELLGLYQAIKEGEITFEEALRARYDQPPATTDEKDAVLSQKLTEASQRTAPPRETVQPVAEPAGKTPETAPQPTQKAIRRYEGDWPNSPEGDELYWNDKLYRFSEATGNYQLAEPKPAEAPPATQEPRRPVFGRREQPK